MTAKQAKLEAIKNRATRYELVLTHGPSGKRLRLSYTSRKNRSGLMASIRSNGEALVKLTGSEEFKVGCGQPPSATLGNWSVAFSGRTQRDAIVSDSELRWFAAEEQEG